jgi:hypothetical protein
VRGRAPIFLHSRSAMPIHSLALELVEGIIDQLYEDLSGQGDQKRMLGFCSLVCKSWLPRSRFYLFREVSVTPDQGCLELEKFTDLLDSEHCTISSYVKTLTLHVYRLAMTIPLVAGFHALERLELRNVKWSSSIGCVIFRNVRILKITHSSFDACTGIAEVVSMCPSLEQLDVHGVYIVLPRVSDITLPSSLRSINLGFGHVHPFMFDWFVSGDQIPPIETLRLFHYIGAESDAITRLVAAFSHSLKNLSLDIYGEHTQGTILSSLLSFYS